jgi:glycosyltransferase involved in cell wall biosynthesis
MTSSICIVIPAYNEERAIGETIREYREEFPEGRIIVVDNNSTDGTKKAAQTELDRPEHLLLFEPRRGKGFAIKRGLSRLSADIYIMTDGDSTYPAKEARRLLDQLLMERADMAIGDRVSGGSYATQNTRFGHSIGNRVLTGVISRLSGRRYADVLSGLRVMSRPFVSMLDVRSTGFQLETEINVIAAHLRADVIEIPIEYRMRGEGSQSKLSTIADGFRILYFAMTNWIAFAPMQAFSLLALIAFMLAAAIGYRVISGFMEYGLPYTTTAVAAATMGIVGILALFTGITLRILGRNNRRRDIAQFLEEKRNWNAKLDERQL